MKIFIAICIDRHIDPVARAFSTLEKAIEYAKGFAKKGAYSPEDFRESKIAGWLYHADFSPESGYVFVIESQLDPEKGETDATQTATEA